jgi:hypothetical protein
MDYPAILVSKYPNTEWILDGDNYEGLTWISQSPKPTQEELDALWPEVEKELKAKAKAKLDAKASLLAKLSALGLTEEEIAAL